MPSSVLIVPFRRGQSLEDQRRDKNGDVSFLFFTIFPTVVAVAVVGIREAERKN
jgi:hypothetical protein